MHKCRPILMTVLVALGAVCAAQAQTVPATALAQSLQQDIASARGLLANGASPWQDARARPQAEPIRALSAELPGYSLWLALKPLDAALREAHREQRRAYIDKDAGLIARRKARAAWDKAAEALDNESGNYPPTVLRLARRQMDQIENALSHHEYHAALCVLWTMADSLGLWDRQAALESAADHVAAMRAAGLRRATLPRGQADAFAKRLDCINGMIEKAITWQPVEAFSDSSQDLGPQAPQPVRNKHWAKEAFEVGGAFAVWRNDQGKSGATPWILNQPIFRLGLQDPPRNTKDLAPCLTRLRDWQYTLGDYRYGWVVNTRVAAGRHWHPHGDWRDMQPETGWPGAGGSQTAGGL